MELVEGPTLADRIAQGPLLDEALPIAKQIASALETAREAEAVLAATHGCALALNAHDLIVLDSQRRRAIPAST